MNEERITYFAQTDARNKKVSFGIKAKDRTRHVYVIGKTGMGKSTLLENMAVQDIKNGEGMAFIDPHGKTADLLLEYVPKERIKDVIYFAPFDLDHPISFNVLEKVDADKRHLVVSGLMSTFKKIWKDAWSARMEYILTNTLLALLEYPEATLLGVNRMLSDKEYRKKVVASVTDPAVKTFWVEEFANYTERMAAEAVPAIQNKIGQFTANALIRNMIGQPKSSFDIRKAMDEKKIMIINLSKGRIGETNANLLGGMLITKIYLAALSRADVPDRVLKTLPNFYLFVDEFQSFANESFADILSEARKYKLNLTIAHQYIEQMEEEVRAAVFGNVGTMIVFRVGSYDAEVLEKEFAPQFTAEDIVNLGFAQIYLKLMIDGISSLPFSATTLPPIPQPEISNADEVLATSRAQFAKNRDEVEKNIADWHAPITPPQKNKIPKPPENTKTDNLHKNQDNNPAHNIPKPIPIPVKPQIEVSNIPKPHAVQNQIVNHTQIDNQNHIQVQNNNHSHTENHKIHNEVNNHKIEEKKDDFISLESLKKQVTNTAPQNQHKPHEVHVKNIKEQDPKNVNELRNALAAVLKNNNSPKKDEVDKKEKNEVKNEVQKGEVSEDVLKQVLKVE
jgi:energy-coupling factor transporter ATP-binding protein EcfA2